MPQHVGMDMEPELRSFASPLNNAGDHVGRQWATRSETNTNGDVLSSFSFPSADTSLIENPRA